MPASIDSCLIRETCRTSSKNCILSKPDGFHLTLIAKIRPSVLLNSRSRLTVRVVLAILKERVGKEATTLSL
jgi:hypothetical protein